MISKFIYSHKILTFIIVCIIVFLLYILLTKDKNISYFDAVKQFFYSSNDYQVVPQYYF